VSRKSDELREKAKRKKTTMKKLMTIAAATALAAVAEAGIAVQTVNCNYTPNTKSCGDVVFKVTGSGKALDPVSKEYTTVSKLKVDGYLVLFPDDSDNDGICCYPTYSLYVTAKIAKNKVGLIFAGAGAEAVDAWTVFGKKLAAAEGGIDSDKSKKKKYKLESQLGVSANYTTANGYSAGTLVYADDVEAQNSVPAIAFFATSFGKATWMNAQKVCDCVKKSEDSEITPGNYSGWFAGVYEFAGIDEECLTCTCTDLGLFGGTWKAKYQSKIKSWKTAVSYQFGAGVVNKMVAEGIE
jgi:hypothetical protein